MLRNLKQSRFTKQLGKKTMAAAARACFLAGQAVAADWVPSSKAEAVPNGLTARGQIETVRALP